MSRRCCVLVLVGLPAAGKTRLSGLLQQALASTCQIHVFCFDHYEQAYETDTDGVSQWRQARQAALLALETKVKFIMSTENPDCRQHICVVDDTMHYRSMRKQVLRIARNNVCGYGCIYLPVDVTLAIERNKARSKPVATDSILRIAQQLEVPEDAFVMQQESSSMGPLLLYIEQCCHPQSSEPEDGERRSADFDRTAKSIMHAVDNAIRVYISGLIQKTPSMERADLAKRLSIGKAAFLDKLRRQPRLPLENAEVIVSAFRASIAVDFEGFQR